MWSNFHTHTNYCDGSTSVADIVKQASGKLTSLGISSHAPVSFDCSWCMKKENLRSYLDEIAELKNSLNSGIELYAGLEIDFVPGRVSPLDFKKLLDYTIGSVHFVDAFADGTPWEIDGTLSKFLIGFDLIFNNDSRAAFARYQELTRQMIEEAKPNIIGHLDKIKIQNGNNILFDETASWYKAEIQKTLEIVKDSDSIVEVNTRGLYLRKTTTTYPSPWILEHVHAMQIPITLSSDAHQPADLINQFSNTAQLLLKIGFQKIRLLHEGVWKDFSFTENGLLL
jgi:histidinol-phosphatase (PHP family)